jgi:hypothetical protein
VFGVALEYLKDRLEERVFWREGKRVNRSGEITLGLIFWDATPLGCHVGLRVVFLISICCAEGCKQRSCKELISFVTIITAIPIRSFVEC